MKEKAEEEEAKQEEQAKFSLKEAVVDTLPPAQRRLRRAKSTTWRRHR